MRRLLLVISVGAAFGCGGTAAQARYYPVGRGEEIWVSSDRYGEAAIRPIVAFIRSLPHGREIGKLSVYVAAPGELAYWCGSEADGCYDEEGAGGWMTVPGEPLYEDESSVEEIVAHEYGHHLAHTRPGGAFGTPRWDIYERICGLTQQGLLFPGAEGTRSWSNPEEAFAESYAALVFPQLGIEWAPYTSLLQPTPESQARIRLDIERPWPKRYAERRLRQSCGHGRDVYRGRDAR